MEGYVYANALLSFLAVPVTVAVAVAAWRRRGRPGIGYFLCLMVACAVWSITAALSMLSPESWLAELWLARARMTAVGLMPLFFLLFCLDYAGRTEWLRGARLGSLVLIPALTQVLNLSPLHPLLVGGVDFVRVGPFLIGQRPVLGPWFPVHAVYSFALVGAGLALLLRQIVHSRDFYRRQAAILFGGLLVAVAASATANLAFARRGTASDLWLDWTVPSFTLIGLSWSWALLRARFLDVMPVALEAVFQSMADAVVVLDDAGRIVDLNPAACALIGRPRAELIGAALAEVSGELSLVVESAPDGRSVELQLGERVLDLQVSSLAVGAGRNVGRLTVLRDISERARMMRDLDAYARTVAHDLKNPLSAVTAFADMILASEAALDEQTRRRLTTIAGAGRSMKEIINSLLLLARVRSAAEVEATALDMAGIVGRVTERLAPQIERSGAQVSLPADWPPARGYAAWVEEVWANYLSNALKYGGSPPRIALGGAETPEGSRFWVRDAGPGLDAGARARLFREFERLGAHRAEGHGLGLSIVSRIAEKLGGKAGVDSELGEGCTFWFTLPRA